MINLAELNENNICIGVKTVKSMINDGRHIEIGQSDFEYYSFRKYEDGAWSEEKFVPDYAQIELDRMEKLEQENNLLKQHVELLEGMQFETLQVLSMLTNGGAE